MPSFNIMCCVYLVLWTCNCDLPCHICISEINFDTAKEPETNEFLELNKCNCKESDTPLIDDYVLIIIKEYEESHHGPIIVFYADLCNMKNLWDHRSSYFIIGSPEQEGLTDLPFADSTITYRNKFRRTRLQQDLGLAPKAHHVFGDSIENGNEAPMVLILLRHKANDFPLSRSLFAQFLFLVGSHIKDNIDSILVAAEIDLLIKQNVVDFAVYARMAPSNSCKYFKGLADFLDITKQVNIATEWDLRNHVEVSVNRCPKSDGSADNNLFLFTEFKLGVPTPKQDNNCQGPHFVLQSRLRTILMNNPSQSRNVFCKRKTPEPCSSGSQVELNCHISEKTVAEQRDCELNGIGTQFQL
jgi:hypothetical protein